MWGAPLIEKNVPHIGIQYWVHPILTRQYGELIWGILVNMGTSKWSIWGAPHIDSSIWGVNTGHSCQYGDIQMVNIGYTPYYPILAVSIWG